MHAMMRGVRLVIFIYLSFFCIVSCLYRGVGGVYCWSNTLAKLVNVSFRFAFSFIIVNFAAIFINLNQFILCLKCYRRHGLWFVLCFGFCFC